MLRRENVNGVRRDFGAHSCCQFVPTLQRQKFVGSPYKITRYVSNHLLLPMEVEMVIRQAFRRGFGRSGGQSEIAPLCEGHGFRATDHDVIEYAHFDQTQRLF